MFCSKCGSTNSDDARFCTSCAFALVSPGTLGPQGPLVTQARNPGVAAVLSFVFCGLGQIYNGQIGKGIAMAVAFLISLASVHVLIGLVTTPLLWIWGVVDAYRAAVRPGFLGAMVILLIIVVMVGMFLADLPVVAPYIYTLF
jgi:TM2 domain-containing membrane protein YozV